MNTKTENKSQDTSNNLSEQYKNLYQRTKYYESDQSESADEDWEPDN